MFIHLAILEDEKVVVISKIFPKARMQSTTQLMSQIGGILPMHCTGIGLLFLSQHDDKYCREFLSRQPLDRYTTTTQTEIPQIMERIQNIRDLQYVINNGEHDEGIVSAITSAAFSAMIRLSLKTVMEISPDLIALMFAISQSMPVMTGNGFSAIP